MKILVLIREGMDYSRPTYDFIHNLVHRYPGKKVEMLDVDTRDGAAMASIYDITEYPAIIAMTYEGVVINTWQGMPLPLIDEVAGMLIAH